MAMSPLLRGKRSLITWSGNSLGVISYVFWRQLIYVWAPIQQSIDANMHVCPREEKFWPQALSVWSQEDFRLVTGKIAPWQAWELSLPGGGTDLPPRPKDQESLPRVPWLSTRSKAAAFIQHRPLLVKIRNPE